MRPDLVAAFFEWLRHALIGKLTHPVGGDGIVTDLPSFYNADAEREEQRRKLEALCMEAVGNPAWLPHDITGDGRAETFCNRSARFIAEGMGCFDFRHDHDANSMISAMDMSPNWRDDSLLRAHQHAMKGGLAFVTLTEYPHGHLAAVAPLPMEHSGSWDCAVLRVANVGRSNGIMRLSGAFKLAQRPLLRAFTWGETA